MDKTLVLMKGFPGSGKSTQAALMAEDQPAAIQPGRRPWLLASTDDFWNHFQMEFDKELLSDAHSWNQGRVHAAMEVGTPLIIVDNTNLSEEERAPYQNLAGVFGYKVRLKCVDGQLGRLAELLTYELHSVLSMLGSRAQPEVPIWAMWVMARRHATSDYNWISDAESEVLSSARSRFDDALYLDLPSEIRGAKAQVTFQLLSALARRALSALEPGGYEVQMLMELWEDLGLHHELLDFLVPDIDRYDGDDYGELLDALENKMLDLIRGDSK